MSIRRNFYKGMLLAIAVPILVTACDNGSNNSSVSDSASKDANLSDNTQFVYVQRDISNDAQSDLGALNVTLNNKQPTLLGLSSPYAFNPGAKLVNRSGLNVDAVDRDILSSYFNSTEYDIKNLNISADGQRVIFAAHGPQDSASHSTWNIYEYHFANQSVRRIINDDAIANAGQDTNPAYTLNGRIVFSSDRSAGNPDHDNVIDSEKPESCHKVGPSEKPSLLHAMSQQGEDIVQLTYGNNHDVEPVTLSGGRIAFIRWSRSYELQPSCDINTLGGLSAPFEPTQSDVQFPQGLNPPQEWPEDALCQHTIPTPHGAALPSNHYSVLQIDADGQNLGQLYKTVTLKHSDEVYIAPKQLTQGENGQLMALVQHQHNRFLGGDILELQSPQDVIDGTLFGNFSPRSLISKGVDLYPEQRSEAGWYSAVSPYRDGTGRLLVSWSQCAAENNGVNSFCQADNAQGEVESRYGIWVFDPSTDTRLPILRARKNTVYTELALNQAHRGLELPYSSYNPDFVDDPDTSSIICDDPGIDPDPVDPDPVKPDPVDPDPVDPNPVDPDPVKPDPVDPDPVDPDPVKPDPVDPDPVDPDPVDPDPVDPDPVDPDPVDPDPVDPDPVDPDPVDPDPVDPDPVDPDPVDPDPVDPDPVDPDPVDPDPVDPNTAPVANAGRDGKVRIGKTVRLDGSGSTDADGDPLTYQWSVLTPESASADLSDVNNDMPLLSITQHGDYVIQLVVNDGELDSQPDEVTLTVGNVKPVANAGRDQTVLRNERVQLDGSKSSDADGDSLTFYWEIFAQPEFSEAEIADPRNVMPTLVPDEMGTYQITLVVNDGFTDSEPSSVMITTENSRPVAHAGDDKAVAVGDIAQLGGSRSFDADNDPLTYQWSLSSKPEGSEAAITDAHSVATEVNIDTPGEYVAQLIVNDGYDNSIPSTVVLSTLNVRPIADAGDDQNVDTNNAVTLDGSASRDADGDELTYHWSLTRKPESSNAVLDDDTAVTPTFIPDLDGPYVAQLIVNDGELYSEPSHAKIEATPQLACDLSNKTQRTIPVIIRDFKESHPDFEYRIEVDYGIVKKDLGKDGLPVYASRRSTPTTTGAKNFNQWYRDVEGVNIRVRDEDEDEGYKKLIITREPGSTIWRYSNDSFFPIDGEGWGNQGNPHNYHFTLETHDLEFNYEGGESFTFRGDDDLWVFINGKLAIDIGGVHEVIERSIDLDERASYLGIEPGNSYTFDLFFAERHTTESNFMFETNINLECKE